VEIAVFAGLCLKPTPGDASLLELNDAYDLLYTNGVYWLLQKRTLSQTGAFVWLIYELAPEA